MINIYDILLNWTDSIYVFDFYEWDINDEFEHIKRIPMFKIKEEDYEMALKSIIKVDKVFLELIKNKTEVYGNRKGLKLEYATLLTDGLRVLAVEFNDKGESIYKSKLLLDEEDEAVNLSYKLQLSRIEYKVLNKTNINNYETRKELKMRKFLNKELDNSYKNRQIEKLKYLYIEYFSKDKNDINDIYNELKNSLKQGINKNHEKIYELLKLSYTKRLVK